MRWRYRGDIDRSTLTAQDAHSPRCQDGRCQHVWRSDEVIIRCICKPKDIKNDVRDALRISTYEIIYLRKARKRDSCGQGVEAGARRGSQRTGLANAGLTASSRC
jgi:16S rRNA (cytosine967-C5)-methyltransferase